MGGMDDELDLEVSDLRTGRAGGKSVDPVLAASAVRDGGGRAGADDGASPRVEPLDPARATSRARLALSRRGRGYAVAALALLVCAGLLLSLPGPQASLRRALAGPTPTPTATLPPGTDTVYLVHDVPWGTLVVDGRGTARDSGAVWSVSGGLKLLLGRGRHTLAYRAALFPSLSCTVSVPAAPADTCPAAQDYTIDANVYSSRVFDLGARLQALSAPDAASLRRAAASALSRLSFTADVPAGDHFLGADDVVATAPTALRATLSFELNTDPQRLPPPGVQMLPGDCSTLCESSWLSDNTPQWQLEAHALAAWRFTFPDGREVRAGGGSGGVDTPVPLAVTWDGAWQVSASVLPYTNSLCESAFAAATAGYPNWDGTSSSYDAPNPAEGCAMAVLRQNATSGPQQEAGRLLYRFGALLAADATAHAALPQLPVANAHERALAQQWIAPQQG